MPMQVTQRISIHALREESDDDVDDVPSTAKAISIHALREESDMKNLNWQYKQ